MAEPLTIAEIVEFPVWDTLGMKASCAIQPAPTTAYRIFLNCSSGWDYSRHAFSTATP
ncbi:hypothetical protein MES4922_90151 [Mesorhizobium ventifaucium]|uniref:Uncharacterized protein n=1 Tax=Mesorhizobium ventifaucium TaxID=666020 RepID=A0ABM9EFV9_9HYPH|nr:hypothetical protein MES4922_90151 [Mesorhizobium ventifaucium]